MFVFRLVGRMIAFAVKATLFVGALAVVAGGTMYMLFDAEQYKKAVTQRLVDVTGRTAHLRLHLRDSSLDALGVVVYVGLFIRLEW